MVVVVYFYHDHPSANNQDNLIVAGTGSHLKIWKDSGHNCLTISGHSDSSGWACIP